MRFHWTGSWDSPTGYRSGQARGCRPRSRGPCRLITRRQPAYTTCSGRNPCGRWSGPRTATGGSPPLFRRPERPPDHYLRDLSPGGRASAQDRRLFVAKGIDYQFQVRFDGKVLHEQEGMFSPVEIDLTDLAREGGELLVVISPVPKWADAPPSRPRRRPAAASSRPSAMAGTSIPDSCRWVSGTTPSSRCGRHHSSACRLRYQLSEDCPWRI